MFTGIIEEIGTVLSVVKTANAARISIEAQKMLEGTRIGDSISTNGVCLTVTTFENNYFTVDVMPETMRKSNLKSLAKGSQVNLERALQVGQRLGGHMVSGHIDGVGIIKDFKKEDNATWVTVIAPKEILRYIVYKGSIAIDGISLTVAYVDENSFKVSLIPLTGKDTMLLTKKVGQEVNLECDMVGKYVEKFLSADTEPNKNNTQMINVLKENGFL